MRAARRLHRDQDNAAARQRREECERADRERQLRLEAVAHLQALGGELLVEIDRDETCQLVDAFADADRFRSADGRLWCVMGEQRCWIAGDEADDVVDPLLLLADGQVGQFEPWPASLTRLDPRRDGHQGREFVSHMPLGPEPRWPLTEQQLAYMIVRYERSRGGLARW